KGKSWKGILPSIGTWFADMGDETRKLFMGGGPTSGELRSLVTKDAAASLAAANAINAGLAGVGGLTVLGAGGLLAKFFGKFKTAKSYKATERVIQNLKDVKVTTAKEEKESKKALQEA
ncbi:MAG TPA: hypothetical protein VMZ91_14835, partial [Candidatus Paceibacterota bacterium]|nr:hypothetical protein [Candidatus Paceibacterota bacterium]